MSEKQNRDMALGATTVCLANELVRDEGAEMASIVWRSEPGKLTPYAASLAARHLISEAIMRNQSRDVRVATSNDARQVNALLRVEDLAKRIHKSVASIRSDVCRKPHALPPMCRLPGTKRLLWREEDVTQWLAEHVVVRTTLTRQIAKTTAPIRRRGRPTKADQILRKTKER